MYVKYRGLGVPHRVGFAPKHVCGVGFHMAEVERQRPSQGRSSILIGKLLSPEHSSALWWQSISWTPPRPLASTSSIVASTHYPPSKWRSSRWLSQSSTVRSPFACFSSRSATLAQLETVSPSQQHYRLFIWLLWIGSWKQGVCEGISLPSQLPPLERYISWKSWRESMSTSCGSIKDHSVRYVTDFILHYDVFQNLLE